MTQPRHDPDLLAANLDKLEALIVRLTEAVAKRRQSDTDQAGPGPDFYGRLAATYLADLLAHPEKMIEQQVHLWRGTLLNYSKAISKSVGQADSDNAGGEPLHNNPLDKSQDSRFKNPLWDTHPYFNFIKSQYELSAKMLADSMAGVDELGQRDRKRLEFISRQIADMLAPSNFLGTNPDAIEKAIETNGQSLVDGLENFVRDVEASGGNFAVTLTDPSAFQVGENIVSTPGEVVFRNRLFELIRYTPTTDEVYTTPLLILPPWINKYYVLDLKPENSFVRYAVSRGFVVFVVSWVNPDETYADVGLDTYLEEGALAAIEVVKAYAGVRRVNTIGYCIGGTLLAIAMAALAAKGDKSIKAATFLATLLDFEDIGDLGVFVDESYLKVIEAETEELGFLSADLMARTFSYLRAKDLVYSPAVKSYLLGEAPAAFDLLFWNSDSTNLPGRMAREYLRDVCLNNGLTKNTIEIDGATPHLTDIENPTFAVATLSDHIAPWKASFRGLATLSGSKTLILSESGHIAGIVNPPAAKKYGYWTNSSEFDSPAHWQEGATHHRGSWWPTWAQWLRQKSGKRVPAPAGGHPDFPGLAPAPGTYVLQRPKK